MAVVTYPIHSNHLHGIEPGLSPAPAGCRPGSDHFQHLLRDLTPREIYQRKKELRSINLDLHHAKRATDRHARHRRIHRSSRARAYDSEESIALARSTSVRLPSDGDRHGRRLQQHHQQLPRLEREEAFRVPRVQLSDYVADEAELYRLGLLYDDDDADTKDEHVIRGPGFSLDCIARPPVSPVLAAARPPKRARGSRWEKFQMVSDCLPLDLSFSSLGGDEDIARFLAPVSETDVSAPVDEEDVRVFRYSDDDHTDSGGGARRPASLHVIYELLEGSVHSLGPAGGAPTEDVVPDLMPDFREEGEGKIEDDEEGEEDDGSDWGFISRHSDDGEDNSNTDAVADDGTASAAEAWVVLGET